MTIKRKLLLSGGLVALLATISVFIPHKSYAFSTNVTITNRAPTVQSANINGSGTNVEPWFAVGEGEYYGPNSYAKAYVPAGQTANITIVRGAGYCVGLGTDVGTPKVTFTAFSLNSNESLGSQVDIARNLDNGTGCGSLKLTLQGGTPATGVTGHENYDEYYIEARLTGPFPGCRDPACDTEKSFQLSTSNGLVGVSKNVIDYGKLPGESQFGIYMRDAPQNGGNNWDWAVQYAPRCKQDNPPQAETVGIYDIDKGVAGYNQPNLAALVDKDNRTDANFTWGLAPAGGPYPVSRPPWTNPGQSGTSDNLSYTSSYQNRYLLEFRDIDWHNTIQVQLPYDEFDAQQSVDCNTPSISCSATASPNSVSPGGSSTITVTGISSGQWPSTYYLRRMPPPSYKDISSPGVSSGMDTVSPSGTTIYTYFVASTKTGETNNGLVGGQVTGSTQCPVKVTVSASFSCTATPDPTDPTGTKVIVVLTNTANSLQGKGYQLRQSPDTMWKQGQPQTNQYVEWPIAPGFTQNFQPFASSPPFTFIRPANATESYTLYNGPAGSGASVVDLNLCGVNPGTVSASCNGSSAPTPGEVGQSGTFSFVFKIVNTTAGAAVITYGSNPPAPAGSITNVSAPNPAGSTINPTGAGGQNVPVSFTAQINYSGTLAAYAMYNGSIIAVCPQPVTAVALPYFQVWNSDVSAGGGFASSTGNPALNVLGTCGGSGYISPANSSAGGNDAGGIRAFGSPYSRGSRSDFGALAMGLIPANSASGIGFWTGLNHQAMFANNGPGFNYGANPPGGFLNGSPQNGYGCTKDYFTDTQANPQPYSGDLQSDIANNCTSNRCQFIANSSTQINAANIPNGKQVTLYVNGDVTITGNIDLSNPGFDPTNTANIPYFNLIVKGNIILTEGVNKLYGVYIAQPDNNDTRGIFATCNNGPDAEDISADINACNSQLVVNGAVIAQHVELLRSHGTLHTPSPDPTGISGNPAEIFNYAPSLIIGNPALASEYGTIEGIFSLSPVF